MQNNPKQPKIRICKNGRCFLCEKKGGVAITPVSNGRHLCDPCTNRNCEILEAFFNGSNEKEIKAKLFDILLGDFIPTNCLIVCIDGSTFSNVTRNVNALYASLRSLHESEA